jgi:hypothetical protein
MERTSGRERWAGVEAKAEPAIAARKEAATRRATWDLPMT